MKATEEIKFWTTGKWRCIPQEIDVYDAKTDHILRSVNYKSKKIVSDDILIVLKNSFY